MRNLYLMRQDQDEVEGWGAVGTCGYEHELQPYAVQEEESVHVVWRMLLFSQKAAVFSGAGTRLLPRPNSIFKFTVRLLRAQVPLLLISSDRTWWTRLSIPFYNTSLGFPGE
jgi:hypothetical protein